MSSSYVTRKGIQSVLVAAIIAGAGTFPANAQMANNPWSFQPQNRASVAALIRQVENEKGASAVTQIAAPPSYTSLVCGGESTTPSASGNTTCVILNHADGGINIGQDAQGNQTATSTGATTPTPPVGADDVLSTLTATPGG